VEILVFDVCFLLEFFLQNNDDQLALVSTGGAVDLGEKSSAHAVFFRAGGAMPNSRTSSRSSISA
jgi:hypothetical protein